MTNWEDYQSVSTAVYNGRLTLSVVKWSKCWGWAIDTVPEHDWKDNFRYLAKGTAKNREQGKRAAEEAARSL